NLRRAHRREVVARIELRFDRLAKQGDQDDLRAVVEYGVRHGAAVQLEGEEAGFGIQQIADAFGPDLVRARAREKETPAHGRAGRQREGRFGAAFFDTKFRHVLPRIGGAEGLRYIVAGRHLWDSRRPTRSGSTARWCRGTTRKCMSSHTGFNTAQAS